MCDGGFRTCVGTTDVSLPVKKQHRQNEPTIHFGIPTGVEVCVTHIPDMCINHRCLTACQKQHRQNKPAAQVNVPTGIEVLVMWDPGNM